MYIQKLPFDQENLLEVIAINKRENIKRSSFAIFCDKNCSQVGKKRNKSPKTEVIRILTAKKRHNATETKYETESKPFVLFKQNWRRIKFKCHETPLKIFLQVKKVISNLSSSLPEQEQLI